MESLVDAGKASTAPEIELVVAKLREAGRPLNHDEICKEFQCDLKRDDALFVKLYEHPDVFSWMMSYRYRWKHSLEGKAELLHLIRNRPDGLCVADVSNAYPTIEKDLQELKDSGDIYLEVDTKTYETMAYPNYDIPWDMVDNELREIYISTEVPAADDAIIKGITYAEWAKKADNIPKEGMKSVICGVVTNNGDNIPEEEED